MAIDIPWARPDFWGGEEELVLDALRSTWISGGPYVDRLEQELSALLGSAHALAVSNGTTAIHLAYLGIDLRPGDEVVVPGFCFLAAANIALHVGAVPVFADVDPDTWCVTAASVEASLTPRTRAIVPVHTYGNVCDLGPLRALADARGVALVEDAAEALFSTYDDRQAGSVGHLGTFSFQATKTITTGEGGLVVTDDDGLAERMRLHRSHGMGARGRYWHEVPGHNFRLTNLQAALGCAQLAHRDEIVAARTRLHAGYRERLGGEEGVTLQAFMPPVEPVLWAMALRLDDDRFPQGRDAVLEGMAAAGIETRPGFYPPSALPYFGEASIPVAEDVARTTISLPSFATLTEADLDRICAALLELRA